MGGICPHPCVSKRSLRPRSWQKQSIQPQPPQQIIVSSITVQLPPLRINLQVQNIQVVFLKRAFQ
jgi:hypothetical protein